MIFTGALLIDRVFEYVDLLCAVIMVLFTICGVITGYLKSIELMFFMFLAQGTLETVLNMGKGTYYFIFNNTTNIVKHDRRPIN